MRLDGEPVAAGRARPAGERLDGARAPGRQAPLRRLDAAPEPASCVNYARRRLLHSCVPIRPRGLRGRLQGIYWLVAPETAPAPRESPAAREAVFEN